MNAREFFVRVAKMRKAQKDYFRTRSKSSLQLSKRYEGEIDAEIERVQKILGTTPAEAYQPNLFGE